MDEKQYKSELLEIRKYSGQSFDKQLVYISGGGLILTIGFVKEIIDLSSSSCNFLLFTSWICFTLALTFNLVSHRTAINAVDYFFEENEKKSSSYDTYTDRSNRLSIFFLFTGITTFILFVVKNIVNG